MILPYRRVDVSVVEHPAATAYCYWSTQGNIICHVMHNVLHVVGRPQVPHVISASTYDKMCADMKAQKDDMSGNVYPHGSRELVANQFTANNPEGCCRGCIL